MSYWWATVVILGGMALSTWLVDAAMEKRNPTMELWDSLQRNPWMARLRRAARKF